MCSPLGLELCRVVSCRMNVCNPVQVIWKNSHFSSSNFDDDGDYEVRLKVQVSVK